MPNQRKADYQQTRNDARAVRGRTAALRPQYGSIRSGVQAYQTGQNNDNDSNTRIREGWKGIIDNPMRGPQTYREGYAPGEINQMKTGASDIVTAGRDRAARGINRQVAAQGMGNTGAGLRSVMSMEPGWTSKGIAARRDVDLDAAEAKRSDYWKGVDYNNQDYWKGQENQQRGLQGLDVFERGREGFNLDAFKTQGGLLNDEADLERIDLASFNPEMNATEGMYQPGFWGKLGGSFANSLGSGLGSGLASYATGGFGNIGKMIPGMGGGGGSIPGPNGAIRTGGFTPSLSGRTIDASGATTMPLRRGY